MRNSLRWKHCLLYFCTTEGPQAVFSALWSARRLPEAILVSLEHPNIKLKKYICNCIDLKLQYRFSQINTKKNCYTPIVEINNSEKKFYCRLNYLTSAASAGMDRSSKCTVLPSLLISWTTKSEYLENKPKLCQCEASLPQ